MAGRFFGKIGICILALMIFASLGSGATIRVGNGPSNDANSLDIGLLIANNGDTIELDNINGTINSTLTAGNITIFDKDLYIDFASGAGIATVRLNNSIQFKDSTRINFTNTNQILNLWRDPTVGSFTNDTLVQFLGSTDLFNSTSKDDSTMVINATNFAGTALNITSNNNGINLSEGQSSFTGHITGDSKIGVNISGQNNYLHFENGNGGDINATDIAMNLVGKNNHIIMDTDNILGTNGRLYICNGATGNYIHDYLGNIGYPAFSIYNGSAYSSSSKWGYFYNSSWSLSGGNMNVTISVRNLPYGGNVSVKALYNNVTGTSGDNILNSTLTVNSSSLFGGLIHNSTESVVFNNMVNEVPVKYTLGGNTLQINYPSDTYVNEYDVGTVRIINFNPVNSITTMNLNSTYTSNWTEYSAAQFAAAQPSFVVDNGTVDHKLLGNLTFAENINLLDLTTVNQLQQLADGITVTNSSIFLNSTALTQFNKSAVLTMYPEFNFTTTGDLVLNVTPDGGAETNLWDGSAYTASSSTYLSSDTIDINTTSNYARIWTKGFSKYTFSKYTAPTPAPTPAPTSAPSGGSSSSGGSSTNDISVSVANNLKTGQTAGFQIARSAIYEVSATVNTDVPKMMVTVEKTSPSRGIEEAPVDVYEYDQVDIYWADDSELNKATLEFKVPMKWLSQKGYSFDDIIMLRYNEENQQWEQLPTEFIGEENGYYLYRATTPGFSWFAIGYEKGATIVSDEKSTKEIEIIAEEESPENLDALKNGAEETEVPEQSTPATPLGAAPFAALILAGMLFFFKKR